MKTFNNILSVLFILLIGTSYSQVPFPNEETIISTIHIDKEYGNKSDRFGYFRENKKTGLVINSKRITEAIYDKVIIKSPYGFIVKKDNKYGFLDKKGKIIIAIKYESIGNINQKGSVLLVKRQNLYGAIDIKGKKILPFKYKKILGKNLINQFVVNDKNENLHLGTTKGKKLASNIEKIDLYKNGAILKSKGKFGLITKIAHTDFIYDTIAISSSKKNKKVKLSKKFKYNRKKLYRLIVKKQGKVGLIDTLNNILVPLEQDEIIFERKYYSILQDKKKGAYLTKCNTFLSPEYDKIYMDGSTYLQVFKDEKRGLVDDATGKLILPIEYNEIHKTEKVFIITQDKKKGVINRQGEIIIPLKYSEIDNLKGFLNHEYDAFYKVKIDDKYGIINPKDEIIIPIVYDWLDDFNKNLFIVGKKGKIGLFDFKGNIIQEPIYDFIENKRTNRSKVFFTKKNGLYGVLDETGKTLLKNSFNNVYTLPNTENDLILSSYLGESNNYQVMKNVNKKTGIFNVHTGFMVIPLVYDEIYQTIENVMLKNTYFLVKKDGKFGLINTQNTPVIDFKYDSLNIDLTNIHGKIKADSFKKTVIVAEKNGRFGVINLLDQTIIPFEYKSLKKISHKGLFKAKKKENYILINTKNQILNFGPFDEIANFEYYPTKKALSFYNGKMQEIDENGKFLTQPISMLPHRGFTSFKDLKLKLIIALDSKNDSLLYSFAKKITPSKHLMYLFKNTRQRVRTKTQYTHYKSVTNQYYQKLLEFKRFTWNSEYFDKRNLSTEDYTVLNDGITTNRRVKNWTYGDRHILEKILRNSLKINGYWISSYFSR